MKRSIIMSTRGLTLVLISLLSSGLVSGEEFPGQGPIGLPAPSALPTLAPKPANTVALTNSMDVLDDKRPLSSGDRVSLRIVEERKPPVDLVVTDSGEMEVPLIGRVAARGKTCRSLATDVKRLLEKDYFYKCTVIIGLDSASQRSRGKIYLMGQVRGQGAMELPPEEELTVSRAILKGGGFSDFANKRKVKLVRKLPDGSQQTTVLDVLSILEKGKISSDIVLQPDDLVIVPERLINF